MKHRAATFPDFRAIAGDLSKEAREEYNLAGFTVDQVKARFRQLVKLGQATTLTYNDIPVGMLFYEHDEYNGEAVLSTSFMSTPLFFKHDSARLGKVLMPTIQRAFGNRPLIAHSFGAPPRVEKWYRIMGYEMISSDGNYRVFRLPPT